MQKKTTTKNYAQSRIEKLIQFFVMMEEKVLMLGKFSAVAARGQGGFGLRKIILCERHVTTRKLTLMQKGKITFNPS